MAEYIEREAAIAAVDCTEVIVGDWIRNNIQKIPAADVAPVVRRRDCRWRHDDSYPMWLPCVEVETDPDWFCADGERREVQDGN